MSDYIMENGRFYRSCKKLLSDGDYKFAWVDRKALPKLFSHRIYNEDDDNISTNTTVKRADEPADIELTISSLVREEDHGMTYTETLCLR